MFFIGQNSNHVYVTYSFHELFIFFWLILVYRYFCFKFDSSLRQKKYCKQKPAILYALAKVWNSADL